MHKNSFTLAEILIAMAIIGVVAALTIPSLSDAYQKRLLTTQLQRAYAEVSQAGASVVTDEMIDDFNYSQAIKDKTFIGKYLVIASERDGFASSYSKGVNKNVTYNLREKMSNNKNDYKCGVTKAGAAICIDKNANGILDVNGENGPNLIGRDAYQITFDPDGTVNNKYINTIIKNNWDIDEAGTDSWNIVLLSCGNNKIQVIKIVRNITGLGLGDAKKLVDNAPSLIKEDVDENDAEDFKKQLEDVGATVKLE